MLKIIAGLVVGGIVLLSVGISLAIKLTSPGPVLFKQKRVGKNKQPFYLYKFRTMYIEAPKQCPTADLHQPDKYITPVGKFLRKTSLDELPQLLNVLKGEMSLVGPRPVLYNQTDLIDLRDKNGANQVKPGVTGWAQINGRDELTDEEKAYFDGEYILKKSVSFDLYCLVKTVSCVFKQTGIKEGRQSI